jgi:hypothetical protein
MTSQLAERRAERELPAGRGRGPGSNPTGEPLSAHTCPVSGCKEQVDPSRLMCRGHWYQLPRQLRDLVWATWRSGERALSPQHLEAVRLAISTADPDTQGE